MIRKHKLAIVVAGVLLLAGVTFSLYGNNLDGLKSDIFRSSNRANFVCTPQAVAPGSRETRQYTANLAELQRLESRQGVLQSDTNVVNNTCNNLRGRERTQCQRKIAELRTIENSINKLNVVINAYQNCKIEQYPRPNVVVDDKVASVLNNGDLVTLGSFTVSNIIDKGYDVAVSAVPFQTIDIGSQGKFSDIQITDGIKTYPCNYFDTIQSMIVCEALDFDPIKPQGSKMFELKARLGPSSAIGDKYGISINGLGFNQGTIPNNPLFDSSKITMNMEVTAPVVKTEIQYVSQFDAQLSNRLPATSVVDSLGNIYVSNGDFVRKFDAFGKYIIDFPRNSGAIDITVDTVDNIYALNSYNLNVQKFDASGKFLMNFGTEGSGDGQFKSPRSIGVDKGGNIYVLDSGNNRVQKFDASGKFLMKFGTEGSGDGQFKRPSSISIDSAGDIYIADGWNYRVQKFDASGKFLMKFGTEGFNDGQFNIPQSIDIDKSGNIYVLDSDVYRLNAGPHSNRVQKFDASGKFLMKFGTFGSDNGQLDGPLDITLDKYNNIYVVDSGNNRIQKFAQVAETNKPSITVLSPTSGPSGTKIILTGTNLNSTDRIVWSGYDNIGNGYGLTLYPMSATPTQLVFIAPKLMNASNTGNFNVYVQDLSNKISNTVQFSITESLAPSICTDSDGGKDPLKYGTITLNGATGKSDMCSPDGKMLTEYYCLNPQTYGGSLAIPCPNGCSNGACLPPPTLTHSWMVGPWSACLNGTQARSVTCQNNLGNTVTDSYCNASTKPTNTQSCSTLAVCTGTRPPNSAIKMDIGTSTVGLPWRHDAYPTGPYQLCTFQCNSGTKYTTTTNTCDPSAVTYAVTYNANGATSGIPPVPQVKTHGESLVVASNSGNLVKTGYTFAGWNTAADGSGTNYPTGVSYTSDVSVTLYAKWIATIVTPTPLTAIANITGTAQVGQILTAGAITPSGATVAYRWERAATVGGVYTGIAGATSSTYVPVIADMGKFIKVTVTGTGNYSGTIISPPTIAIAAAVASTYTVTFDSQGATMAATPSSKIVVTPATTIDTFPITPVKTGYTFSGWYTAVNGGTEFTVTTPVTTNTIVYAKWVPIVLE